MAIDWKRTRILGGADRAAQIDPEAPHQAVPDKKSSAKSSAKSSPRQDRSLGRLIPLPVLRVDHSLRSRRDPIEPPSPPPPAPPPPAAASSAASASATAPANQIDSPSPYQEFEDLGLVPEKKPGSALSPAKLVVNVYRLLGFLILTLVVVLLVSYIGTSVFYFTSARWLQPMVVSPTDERVLELRAKLAEQSAVRDQLVAELGHTERYIALQEKFQADYDNAVKTDLADRKAHLRRLRNLASGYAGARTRIKNSNSAFAEHTRESTDQEFKAGLIDKDHYLSRNNSVAQLEQSNLSLVEKQAEFDARAASLAAEATALDTAVQRKGKAGGVSYDVLRIKQDYELSVLEAAKARGSREALKANIKRYQAIIDSIAQAAYLRAAERRNSVAFVPYGNLGNMAPGTALYSCALEMLLCRRVGQVVEVLAGEVNHKHPHREKMIRGQLVEVALDRAEAGEKNVLFAGRAPLFL
jgi:hypothetical protein